MSSGGPCPCHKVSCESAVSESSEVDYVTPEAKKEAARGGEGDKRIDARAPKQAASFDSGHSRLRQCITRRISTGAGKCHNKLSIFIIGAK